MLCNHVTSPSGILIFLADSAGRCDSDCSQCENVLVVVIRCSCRSIGLYLYAQKGAFLAIPCRESGPVCTLPALLSRLVIETIVREFPSEMKIVTETLQLSGKNVIFAENGHQPSYQRSPHQSSGGGNLLIYNHLYIYSTQRTLACSHSSAGMKVQNLPLHPRLLSSIPESGGINKQQS